MKTKILFLLLSLAVLSSFGQGATVTVYNSGTTAVNAVEVYWCFAQFQSEPVYGDGGTVEFWGHQYTTGNILPGTSQVITTASGWPDNTNICFGIFQGNYVVPSPVAEVSTTTNGYLAGSVFLYANGSAPPCLTNLVFSVQNNGQYQQGYFAENFDTRVYLNYGGGAPPGGATVESTPQYVEPGQTGYIFVNGIPCTNASAWVVAQVGTYMGTGPTNPLTPIGAPVANQPVPVGNDGYGPPPDPGPASGQGAGLTTLPGSGQYNPTNPATAGTNSPILFTQSPTNGTQLVTEQGDAALYTAVVNAGNQANANAQTANSLLLGIIGTNVLEGQALQAYMAENIGATVSNGALLSLVISNNFARLQQFEATNWGNLATNGATNNLTLTNYATATGQTNEYVLMSNFWATAISNYQQSLLIQSNTAGSYGIAQSGSTNGYFSTITNGAGIIDDAGDATNFANAQQGAAIGTLSDMQSDGENVYDGDGLSGDTPIFTINASQDASLKFVIQPDSTPVWTELSAVAYHMWTYLLVLAYYAKIIKEVYKYVISLIEGNSGNLPDLQTAGFNIPGAVLFPILTVAVMVLWATALAWIFTGLTGQLGFNSMTTTLSGNPLAGADSMGIQMVLDCFPVSLAFGLVSAYWVWRISVVKVLFITGVAKKSMPGR